MKVLILCQWCYPEPDLKTLPFAREIKKNGHEVEILTGFPNYPGGKLYPGYDVKFYQKEVIDGITIHRVPLYPSHSQNKIGRILNYLSFALASALWGLFVVKKVDVIYAYHPPATVSFPAIFLKIFKRIPVVYDIQDLWPDTLSATGMIGNPFILKLVGVYCQWSYRLVSHICVLSEGFKRKLMERGIPEKKITVIKNWSLDIEIPQFDIQNFRKNLGWEDKTVVLFAGNIGPAQKLEVILNAAKEVENEKLFFSFLGDGVSVANLKDTVKKENISNVQFLPRVGREEVGKYLKAADLLLVHLNKDPLFKITVPSKTQAYLKTGKPILMGVEGDASEIVQDASAGYCFEPENTDSLIEAVKKYSALPDIEKDQLSKNAQDFYERELSLEVGTKKFINLFESIKK